MIVTWIVSEGITKVDGRWISDLASNRYRVLIPMKTLVGYGHTVSITVNVRDLLDNELDILIFSDVAVFAKNFNTDNLEFARKAKLLNKPIVVDICDIYSFRDAGAFKYYETLIGMADVVVANSNEMANSLSSQFDIPIVVIEDPYESTKQLPRFRPNSNLLKLVWFGYNRNLPALMEEILSLAQFSKQIPIKLSIVTNGDELLASGIVKFNQEHADSFYIEYLPWSHESTSSALESSDIVLIPNKMTDDGLVKSANRIIESLLAGRFICAHPTPSYLDFSDWVYVGDNLLEGIVWALNNPNLIEENILQAQEFVEKNYSPEKIGKKWNTLLSDLIENKTKARQKQSNEPVRLNLGCGDKILPDYINVDVVAARAGKKPDVISDLHKLTLFQNDYADEILSVHVVEHFWRWEVEDVLKEWIRGLKPGGKMIVECPNLKSACEEFLKNPDVAASGGPEGQRSMWVFYGDPRWQDPLMVHRWGYTPQSLSALLSSVGLVNVRQEAAQYKLREPRDMRIVAEKPR